MKHDYPVALEAGGKRYKAGSMFQQTNHPEMQSKELREGGAIEEHSYILLTGSLTGVCSLQCILFPRVCSACKAIPPSSSFVTLL